MTYLVMLQLDDEDAQHMINARDDVVGVYRRPKSYCKETGHGKKGVGFTKGRKWGWWVCGQCRRPKREYWRNIFKDTPFGRNLLEEMR